MEQKEVALRIQAQAIIDDARDGRDEVFLGPAYAVNDALIDGIVAAFLVEAQQRDTQTQEDERMFEQCVRDLYEAHNEILRLQGCADSDLKLFNWPEWSAPANTIRWIEKRLGKALPK